MSTIYRAAPSRAYRRLERTAGANELQRTLRRPVTVSGTGLHSGNGSTVTIRPAEQNSGIVFVENGERVEGIVWNVIDTSRGTTLGLNGTRFRTVEHLLAALVGMGVDNAYIEVNGSEVPALDGSALGFVEAIGSVGTVTQPARRPLLVIEEPVAVKANGSFILAVPAREPRVTYVMRYEHRLIGSQSVTFALTEKRFAAEIAPARTFVLYDELADLMSQELAKGGSLMNAIVVWPDRLSSKLRFDDELARHKVLDLMGDLALIGGKLSADIVAVKSGHALNVEFARAIKKAARRID